VKARKVPPWCFSLRLSELLESWSVGRARRAIAALLKLTPQTALVRGADGVAKEMPVTEVAVGAEISVRSGSSIPLDGEVIAGDSAVNQAPITGESVPVEKKPGDPVFAGTINGEGSLTVRVTKAASDSTLARIIKLVEEAEEQKAPTQRFVDKFATIYTPAVFGVALLVALLPPLLMGGAWSEWTYRALVLLVIACPCALVIATPVSIVSGLTALARRGVLIKGGAHLEAVGKLRALAVDKTGTITQGRPQVTGVIPLGDMTEEEVLRRAAAIDAHSEHPLAKAVVAAAKAKASPGANPRSINPSPDAEPPPSSTGTRTSSAITKWRMNSASAHPRSKPGSPRSKTKASPSPSSATRRMKAVRARFSASCHRRHHAPRSRQRPHSAPRRRH
jgi:Cd2+/Zn2+-exporting ATPase